MSQHPLPSREDRAAVSRRIRDVLCARGLSTRSLAKRMGRSPSAVDNVISGGNPAPAARLRLELAMELAFWTPPAALPACLAVAAYYAGRHPRTLPLHALDDLARRHLRPAGIRGRIRPREKLVARLEAHALAKSTAVGLAPAEAADPKP